MKRIDQLVVGGVVGSLWVASAVYGAFNEDIAQAYQPIIQRNAFGLKPAPPPVDPATLQPPAPPVNIKFTGITTTFGVRKAYFMVPMATNANMFTYPSLREGEKDGVLEVTKIDESAGAVEIRNAGVAMTLTFESHGNKAVSTPIPGMIPPGGAPRMVPGVAPGAVRPGVQPGAPPQPMVMPSATAAVSPSPMPIQPRGVQFTFQMGDSNLRTIPSRSLRTTPAPQSAMTAEQSEVLMEATRIMNADKIAAGQLPPLPPTVYSGALQPPSLPSPDQSGQLQLRSGR